MAGLRLRHLLGLEIPSCPDHFVQRGSRRDHGKDIGFLVDTDVEEHGPIVMLRPLQGRTELGRVVNSTGGDAEAFGNRDKVGIVAQIDGDIAAFV